MVTGEAGNLGPALNEGVIRQSLRRALLAFTDRVEAVCKLSRDFGLCTELGHELTCGAFAVSFEHADEMVDHFPNCKPFVFPGVPTLTKVTRF